MNKKVTRTITDSFFCIYEKANVEVKDVEFLNDNPIFYAYEETVLKPISFEELAKIIKPFLKEN